MSEIQTVLSRLEELGCKPQRNGSGWKALCPSHSDKNASLSVSESTSGKLLLNCFAGCSFEDILSALDIQPDKPTKPVERVKTPNLDKHTRFDQKAAERLVSRSGWYLERNPEALAALSDSRGVSLETVRLYSIGFDAASRRWVFPVHGAGGQLVAVKMHRSQPDQEPKAIQPAGSSAGLFCIPAIDKASEIILTEGEFDAACCHSATGLVAVSPSAGCSTWKAEWNEVFRDKRVILVPDRDEPGMRFVRLVTENLSGICQLLVVDTEDYPAGCKDCCDIVLSGGAEALQTLISNAVESVPVCEEKTCQSESVAVSEETIQPVAGFPTTEIGLGERFVAQHGVQVRFCYQWNRWLVYQSGCWKHDNGGDVTDRMIQTVRSIYSEAALQQSGNDREEIGRFARRCESVSIMGHGLEIAKAKLSVQPEDFDKNPLWLNCRNGVLDLQNGVLLPHKPEQLLSQQTATEFDQEARSELWERCVAEWACGDTELKNWLCGFVGYCLTGLTSEHVFPIFWGHGANGKSCFTEAVKGLLHDYAGTLPVEVLADREQHPTGLAGLYRKRFVSASESNQTFRLREGLIKSLCSDDTLTARRMREDYWTFLPSHKLVLATNNKPMISGTDLGVWRRVRLVPWNATVPKPDKRLLDKLRGDYAGILNWGLSGCVAYLRDRALPACGVIDKETQSYRDSQDIVGRFIGECCSTVSEAQVQPKALSEAFDRWSRDNGIHNRVNLRSELEKRGLQQKRTKHSRFWVGIGLLVEDESWIG